MRRIAVLAALCFALTPAAAQASSASRDGGLLRYHAASAEHNALVLHVERDSNGTYVIWMRDPGASVAAGANCQSVDAHTVICPHAEMVTGVDIDLGDEDDSYTGSGAPDVFSVAPGSGPIRGGPGNDRIAIAPDAFETSSGFINGGADGGPGNDVLTGSVGVNSFEGGPGDDVIDGAGGDDRLSGGDGNDRIVSGPGADRVTGGPGDDRLELEGLDFAVGGTGDDVIALKGQDPATVVCSAGSDVVLGDSRSAPRPGPWLSRTCELYALSAQGQLEPPWPVAASRSGRLVFRIPCSHGACHGRLSIRSDRGSHALLATRPFTIHRTTRIAIRLPHSVVRRARARRTRLRARLYLPAELDGPAGWRFGLRL